MKKILSFLVLLIVVKSICLSQIKDDSLRNAFAKYYGLDIKKLEEWRNDSSGCEGKRIEYLIAIKNNKLLTGMPQKIFLFLFGKPNEIENESFVYYITIVCDKQNRQIINTEFYYWVIVFKDDKVELMLPRMT